MREQLISQYHDLLQKDAGLDSSFLQALHSDMRAFRMMYGNRELGVALRPHFVSLNQYDQLANSAAAVSSALEKLTSVALADEKVLARLRLSEAETTLALIDPGFASPAINTRVDGFISEDGIKFVEFNAENPSSLVDQAGLNQILLNVPAMQRIGESYRLRQFSPEYRLYESLLETWKEWGGKGMPHLAILDWADLPTRHEFNLLRNYFVSHGLPAIICTPDELEYENGKLRRGEFEIDLVYKRVVIHEFLARYDLNHPLVRAYAEHKACVVNPFRCKLLHKKASFELLTDEELLKYCSTEEQRVIAACVPWTRSLREESVSYKGKAVDLVPFVRKYRSAFVLKPNDDYGGRGIFFGSRMDESAWDDALKLGLSAEYIVQEAIDLHPEIFPVFNDTEWGFQPMYVDTNPFLFRGKPDGALVRLSESPVVNVTSGGGETGFFVIEQD